MLPVDLDILKKREEIPIKLAELSYLDPNSSIELLRKWGEKKSPITVLHQEICECLKKGSESNGKADLGFSKRKIQSVG